MNHVLACFSPQSKGKEVLYPGDKSDIDILIATDCISEGQNLQNCDFCINYDIHWNPVRIIQRFGRIDRIGSRNAVIQLVNFWPDLDLDEYINLKSRVETRMRISVMASTGDDDLINQDEKGDLEYRRSQLKRLYPFYIIYIGMDGEIITKHLQPKDTLDVMRHLARGKKEPDKMYADKNKLEHVMRQRIRPVKASDSATGERQFSFRVYFDKVSRKELECLRWSLDFCDSECAHKLGRGKPFGFGSVKIHIDDLKIQKFHPETGKLELISVDYKDLGANVDESGEAIESLKLMVNWKNRPRDVSYPVLGEAKEGESFRWFVKNRKNVDSKGMQPAFSKILPKASEELGEKRNQRRRLNKDQ